MSRHLILVIALGLTASPGVASAQELPAGCSDQEVALEDGACASLVGTRWQITAAQLPSGEQTFLLELRPDGSLLTSHPLGTWPENDGWFLAEDTLTLTLGGDSLALRFAERAEGERLVGELWSPPRPGSAAALDPSLEPPRRAFRAAPATSINAAYDTIAEAYDGLMRHLHPSASSAVRIRLMVESAEELTEQLLETSRCEDLEGALQAATAERVPELSSAIAAAHSADFEPTPEPGEGLAEESLADAHAADYARRMTRAHKSIHAHVLACAEEPGVAEAFAALVSAIEPAAAPEREVAPREERGSRPAIGKGRGFTF